MLWVLLLLLNFAHGNELWLKVGEVRRLPAASGKAVRIGSHGVIKVIDGEDHVRVVGLKPGSTPLVIGETNYTVRVSFSSQKDFVFALRETLKEMMGLKLDADVRPIAITGTLLRFSDWLRLAELARRYQGEYVFKAQALPDVGEKALHYFVRLAREKRFSHCPAFAPIHFLPR